MSEASFKHDPVQDKGEHHLRRVYLLAEFVALGVLAGTVLWLSQNYQPRSFFGTGLLDASLWILIFLISAWGSAGSLIPYYVGQRGTEAIFEHYPRLDGRPQLVRGNSQLLFSGMGRLTESAVINIKNKSHSVTADIAMPHAAAEGVIVAQGGMFGGWSLYAKEGKLKYCYNLLGHKTWFVESEEPIPAGQHQVRMEFAYDGGGIGKGGLATLVIDGEKVGAGRVEETHALGFSATETCEVGSESESPVSPEYGPRDNEFSGEVNWVQIDLGLDDHSHLITPEQRLSFAMARQ